MIFYVSIPISAESFSAVYRNESNAIKTLREGVKYVQQRMEELQNQHLMDQQLKTESRLRVLALISAIFLPLTLIAGIYGTFAVVLTNLETFFLSPLHPDLTFISFFHIFSAPL